MGTSSIGTGGDYTTISAWESDVQGDFVTATDGEVGELKAETFDERVVLSGATTSATYKWTLKPEAGAGHGGVPGAGAVCEDDTGSSWAPINLSDDHAEFFDLDIAADHSGGNEEGIYFLSGFGGHCDVKRCIVRGKDYHQDRGKGIAELGSGTVTCENCWFSNFRVCATTSAVTLLACTVIRQESDSAVAATGIRYSVAKNCCSFHHGPTSGHKDYLNLGTGSTNNASSDASGSTGLQNLTAADEFTDITDLAMDLSIKSGGDETLVDAGTDLSGTFTDDIAGNTRGATFDVGCFELIAAGGVPPAMLVHDGALGARLLNGGMIR